MEKFKKQIAGLLIIVLLFLLGIYINQFTFSDFSSPPQQANRINKSPQNIAAVVPNAALRANPHSAVRKLKKQRILSEREKFEEILREHPFNNRVRKIDTTEVEGDDIKAREEREEEEEKDPDRPDLAYEQDFLRTMDPALLRPTPELLTDEIKNNHFASVAKANVVRPRMPGDNTSVETNWKELGPNNVGGRTRALAWDPNDVSGKKVWAGGVTGGLWYNNDITSSSSSWVKVDDLWATLSITKIVFDPNNSQIAYVATGEGFYVGKSIGAGIWKTTNGGTSWSQISSTANFKYINDLAIRIENNISVIYAAVDINAYEGSFLVTSNSGLQRSADGGTSWTQVLPNCANGNPYVPASISFIGSNRIWVGTKRSNFGGADPGGGRVLYSDLGTAGNWTVAAITPAPGVGGRVTVVCAPSNPNYVYCFIENANNNLVQVNNSEIILKKTTDNGASWTSLAIPDDADNGISPSDFARGQAFYDQAIAVDPNNPSILLIGGIDLFRSSNEGASWTQISKWSNNANLNTLSCSYVHADQHAISFKPGSSTQVIFGNDGGVFYSSDLTNAATTNAIAARNKEYNVTQFYTAAIHPTLGNNTHLAGAQDNGTQQFNTDGMNATVDKIGGDGAFCFIDQSNPTYQVASYVYNSFYYSINSGSSFSTLLNDDETGSFINPACYDNNQHALYTFKSSDGGGGSIYLVKNINSTPATSTINVANLTSDATAFKVSPYTTTSTTLFIGTSSGKLIKLTNANNTPVETNITGSLPNGSISCIEIGRDENELLVTFFNYGINKIYYSSNGGSTWNSKMGNFPNIPVRWALFNPNLPTTQVILATELGIYGTTNFNDGSPSWSAKNTGFANVRTDMLQMRTSDYKVIAATHGRGLYSSMGFSEAAAPTITSFTPTTSATGTTVTITGTNLLGASAVSFGGTAANSFTVNSSTSISAVVNAGNCGSVNVTTPGGIATKTGFSYILPTPTATVSLQPTCTVATGTISVSSSITGLTFSINGTTYSNTTGVFTSVAAGNYSLTAKNTYGCLSNAASITVNAQPTTPTAPIASISAQPSCTVATGTVSLTGLPASGTWTVTTTGGATLAGSGTSTNFTSLAAGTYTFTVSNGACSSVVSSSVTINAQPASPSSPTATVTIQPTCNIPTGTISVSSSTAGLSFSIDGSTYSNTNGVFSSVAAGTYSLTSKNSSGCVSAAANMIVNPPPGLPSVPTVVITQPSCSVATGTISVSSSTSGLTFSIDGSTYSNTNGIFSSVATGNYSLTAKNVNGCVSNAAAFTLNAQPTTPTAPGPSVTAQPTCTVATGTVALIGLPASGTWTVTATGGATLSGSGATANFSNIAAGNYSFTVSNGACTSVASSSITINAQPPTPATPTAGVTAQPTCFVPTGTILVSSSTAGLTFSIDGTDYTNISGSFTSVIAGNYSLTAKNSSGCISNAANLVVNTPNASPSLPTAVTTQPNCSVATGTISVNSSTSGLNFSIDGVNYSNSNGIFTNLIPGNYNLIARNANLCISGSVSIIINAQPSIPAAPSVTTTQPTCTVSTGNISVSSGTNGLTFSNDGTNYNSSNGIFSSLAPGNYNITARNTSGCTSAATITTINAQLETPSAPTATVSTQPSCNNARGTITVSSSTVGLAFSIDGVNYTNANGIFTNVVPGTYNLTARNASGCTSTASSLTVNTQPSTPAAPVATVSAQPSCTLASATITISSSTAGLTFSIDGTNYTNSSATISGVSPGTYNLTARNSSGCTSTATSLTVNAQPATPATPVATVTAQPTCTVSTGAIAVSSPTTGLTFSIDGINYTNTNGIFTNVIAGTYNLSSKNTSNCISAAVALTVTAQPATPSAPVASVTAQPTCTVATGTVTVSSPTTGLTFIINGISYSNSNGILTNIAQGTFNLTARNTSGCTSTATSITINAAPAIPATPAAIVAVQATCAAPKGTIMVTTSIANLSFSIDGIDFTNTNGIFTNLSPGNYTVTAKNNVGCTNTSSSITVSAPPDSPATPSATVTAQPTCAIATGTIAVSSPTIGLTFSIDGIDYSNTNGIFTRVATGNYSLTAKNTIGCISAVVSLTVDIQPTIDNNAITLSSAAGTNDQSTCINTSIKNITYSTSGVSGATFTGLPSGVTGKWSANVVTISGTPSVSGTFNYTVTLTGGCINLSATGAITSIPNNTITLSSSAETINQTLCTNTPIATILYAATGATGANFSGLPAGVVGNFSANVITISGTPLIEGAYNYTVTLTGGCGMITSSGNIIAKPIAISPTITAGSTSFCPGGSMLLTSSATTENQWYKNGVSITGANKTTYAANEMGSYTVTNFINGCNSFPSVAKIITANNIVSPPIISSISPASFCAGSDIKLSSNTATGIQWQLNGSNILGATKEVYYATEAGDYTVLVTANSCVSAPTTTTYLPAPNKPIVSASSAKTFCMGDNVILVSNETAGNLWYRDGVLITGATGSSYTASTTGAYTDSLTNSIGCKAGSTPINILVKAAPPKPLINWNGSVLSTNSSATSFQWSVNNVALFGATQSTYKPLTIGLYKIQVTNSDGCNTISDSFNLVVTALNNPATTSLTNLASVYPNPASPILLVKFKEVPNTTLEIRLMASDGRSIQMVKTKEKLTTIPINNVPSGRYYIKITGKNYNQTETVIISR
jgi:hypothetical protein